MVCVAGVAALVGLVAASWTAEVSVVVDGQVRSLDCGSLREPTGSSEAPACRGELDGPRTIAVAGALVAVGLGVGACVTGFAARRRRLDVEASEPTVDSSRPRSTA